MSDSDGAEHSGSISSNRSSLVLSEQVGEMLHQKQYLALAEDISKKNEATADPIGGEQRDAASTALSRVAEGSISSNILEWFGHHGGGNSIRSNCQLCLRRDLK